MAAVAAKVIAAIEDYRPQAARTILEPALAASPNDQSLRGALAALFVAERDADSAAEVALSVCAEKPTDPQVLQNIVTALNYTCHWTSVIEIYERCMANFPSGSSSRKTALESVLLAYAKLHRHSDVQKVAAKLKTEAPGDAKYIVWGVIANLNAAPEGDSANILLKLAAMTMDKQIQSPIALPTPGALSVGPQHCMILTEALERQGNYQAAIDFASSSRCRVLSSADRLEQLARFHRLGGDVRVATALYRHLWTLEPENWNYSMNFADALQVALTRHEVTDIQNAIVDVPIPALGTASPLKLPVLLSSEATAVDVAETLVKASGTPPRGLQLARLELYLKAERSTVALARAYTVDNATRPSCFLDVIKYIPAAGGGGDVLWMDALRPAKTDVSQWTADEHACNVIRLQLWGAVDTTLPTSDEATLSFIQQVMDAQAQCTAPTEVGDSAHSWPQYLVTACNMAARRYANVDSDTQRSKWAEIGLRLATINPTDHKYPAVHLFAILFAHALGMESSAAINALDFKSVQHDSMAFLCLAPLLRGFDVATTHTYASQAAVWYSSFERDVSNLVGKAYQNVAWTQLRGLARFERSINHSVARVEWYGLSTTLLAFYAENVADVNTALAKGRGLKGLLSLTPDLAQCNDDRSSIAAAALQALPGSVDQQRLLGALLPSGPSAAERLVVSQGVVALVLCLHDLSQHVQWIQKTAGGAKAAGGKKGKGAPATVVPRPQYASGDASLRLVERTSSPVGPSAVLSAIATFIGAVVHSTPDNAAAASAGLDVAFATYVKSIADATSKSVLGELSWSLPAIVVTLRVLGPIATKHGHDIPVKRWAQSISTSLRAAEERVKSDDWTQWSPRVADSDVEGHGIPSVRGVRALHQASLATVGATLKYAASELEAVFVMK